MDSDRLLATLTTAPREAPLADDVVLEDHGQGAIFRGRAAVAPVLRAYFGGGFPDGRVQPRDRLADGEAVALAFLFRGRQDGVFLGLPATGREVAVPMILLCRHAAGQIRHIAWYYDAGTLLRQLGLIA